MPHPDLWKYCTPRHCNDFLLSLRLLGESGWPPEKELACLYAVSNEVERHYRRAVIPKRDGSARVLDIPDPLLARIQRNILRRVLDGRSISPHATAYHRGADILTNAAAHTGKPLLLKLDIRDFFGSINFPMVRRAAFPSVLFPPAAGTLLAELCCLRDRLPQGAPGSAAISNLVMRPFDEHMAAWCAAREITYTRYCDDMAFSGSFDAAAVTRKVRAFLRAMGFALNEDKTCLVPRHRRQTVTGVVVNQTPQVPRDYRRALRQEIHHCLAHGAASHLERTGSAQSVPDYLAALRGKRNFVLHINPEDRWFREAKPKLDLLCRRESDAKRGPE